MELCGVCTAVLGGVDIEAGGAEFVTTRGAAPHHRTIEGLFHAARIRCALCWPAYSQLNQQEQVELAQLESHIHTFLPNLLGDFHESSPSIDASSSVCTTIVKWTMAWTRTEPRIPRLALRIRLRRVDCLEAEVPEPASLDSCSWNRLVYLDHRLSNYILAFLPGTTAIETRQWKLIDQNTGSISALTRVSTWLNECLASHTKCTNDSTSYRHLPTRLIDVGRTPDTFGIVEGRNLPSNERYLTLSHRWSSSEHVLLTQWNLSLLKAGAPTDILPKTFQDAILVAKHLGVRYLWIDSLCIIQEGDDGEDWKTESTRMAEVYKNSLANIAADFASQTGGLFADRDMDSDFYGPTRLKLRITGVGDVTDWVSVPKFMWINEVEGAPLNERGWVLQERALATRVVHFGRREIFWECCEKSLCESFPVEIPPPHLFHLGESVSIKRRDLWEGSPWAGDENFPISDAAYEVWDDIAKTYSSCQLTYATDRLVAVSGIARHMKTIIQDQYVAGMWRKRLAAELAWWIRGSQKHTFGEEPPYHAPSFSWASVCSRFYSSGPFALGILVTVALVSMGSGQGSPDKDNIVTNDVFGPVYSPNLQLRVTGELRSIRLRYMRRKWHVFSISESDVNLPEDEREEDKDVERGCTRLAPIAFLDFHIRDSDRAVFEEKSFHSILWRDGPDVGEYDMQNTRLSCMLVEHLDRGLARFRRIGWFMTWNPDQREYIRKMGLEGSKPAFYDKTTRHHTLYLV